MSSYHSLIRKYNLEMELDSLLDRLKSKLITSSEYQKEIDRIIDEKKAQVTNHHKKLNHKPKNIQKWENSGHYLMQPWFESLLCGITPLLEDDLYLKWKELIDSGSQKNLYKTVSKGSQNHICHDQNCDNPFHNHAHHNHTSSRIKTISSEQYSEQALKHNSDSPEKESKLETVDFDKRFSGHMGEQLKQVENYFWHDLGHKFTNDLCVTSISEANQELIVFSGIVMALGLPAAKNALVYDNNISILGNSGSKQKASKSLAKNLELGDFLEIFGKEGLRFFCLYEYGQNRHRAQYQQSQKQQSQKDWKSQNQEIFEQKNSQETTLTNENGQIRDRQIQDKPNLNSQSEIKTSQMGKFELKNVLDSYNQILVDVINKTIVQVSGLADKHLSGIVDWNREYEVISSESLQEIESLKNKQRQAINQTDNDQEYQSLYTEMLSKTDQKTDLGNFQDEFQNGFQSEKESTFGDVSRDFEDQSEPVLKLDLNLVYTYLYNFQPHLAFQALVHEFVKVSDYLEQTKPWILAQTYQNKEDTLDKNLDKIHSEAQFLSGIFGESSLGSRQDDQVGDKNENQSLVIWSKSELEAREKVDKIISSAASAVKVLNDALAIFLPDTAFRVYQTLESDFVKKSPNIFEKILVE